MSQLFKKLTIVLLATSVLSSCSSKKTDKQSEVINNIKEAIVFSFAEGEGTVVKRNEKEEKAYVGMRLLSKDIVTTDEESRTYLRVDDTKNILMDTDTSILIADYKNKTLKMELLEGEFFFDVVEKLEDGEELTFKIANTTMSIRGTSGSFELKDNKATLHIYTGEGFVKTSNDKGEEVAYSLYPLTKMEFDTTDDGEIIEDSISIGIITRSEVPETLQIYAHDYEKGYEDDDKYDEELKNYSYIEELREDAWEDVTIEKILPPIDFNPLEMEGDYYGWKQNKDGSWHFVKGIYDQNKGPLPYEEADKPAVKPKKDKTTVITENKTSESSKPTPTVTYPNKSIFNSYATMNYTYNGTVQTCTPTGFDGSKMNIAGNTAKDVGTYHLTITPKEKWSDKTTTPINLEWKINPYKYTIKLKNVSYEYASDSGLPSLTDSVSTPINGISVAYTVIDRNTNTVISDAKKLDASEVAYITTAKYNAASYPNYDINVVNGSITVKKHKINLIYSADMNNYAYDGNNHYLQLKIPAAYLNTETGITGIMFNGNGTWSKGSENALGFIESPFGYKEIGAYSSKVMPAYGTAYKDNYTFGNIAYEMAISRTGISVYYDKDGTLKYDNLYGITATATPAIFKIEAGHAIRVNSLAEVNDSYIIVPTAVTISDGIHFFATELSTLVDNTSGTADVKTYLLSHSTFDPYRADIEAALN